MTSLLAKTISKKILGESLQNKFGKEDPYFERVPATRLDGRPSGKVKKRKKALPPGISDHDGQVLTKVKRRAYRLDMALFSFLGVRFGWGSVIGLIPAAGDAMDTFMALMVLKTCCQVEGGLPAKLKVFMLLNIAFDFVIGLVPLLGDLADALFRANTRNAMLLEDHLREKGKKQLRQSGIPIPAVDPSSPEEFDRARRDSPPGYHSDSPTRNGSGTSTPRYDGSHNGPQPGHAAHAAHAAQAPMPTPPESARVRDDGANRGGGFFGRNNTRPHDVEMGLDGNERHQNSRQPRQQRGRR